MRRRFDERALIRLRDRLALRPAINIEAPELKRASVLIPIIREGESFSLIFSRRAENLAAHSGQIAFPGGGVEEGETLTDAALREAEEEVGIPPRAVELIGRLDDLVTNSGFLVAPFVALDGTVIGGLTRETQKMMEDAFKNMRFAWKITAPFQVVESNAHRREGNTLIWDYDFKKLQELGSNPKAMNDLAVKVVYKK